MNQIEQHYFIQLYEKRKNLAVGLMDYEARGVWTSLIEKYADSAHFVYELLQNADDAKATKVDMRLEEDGFFFKHNGTIHFTISNPQTPEADTKKGRYGHLNSLTAIGASTKPEDFEKNKIGKFGIGFKSVFQYTSSPEVYDDNICFRLVDYIVPEIIEHNHEWRKAGETLFYLPFDKKGKSKKETYKEIEDRLKSLDSPILFLHNLTEISWSTQTGSSEGMYSKEVKQTLTFEEIKAEHIFLHNFAYDKPEELWMFTRNIKLAEGLFPISVGYYLIDGKKIDVEKKPKIFCFFPTFESLDLCFVMHAPFALVDNRQQIKRNEVINSILFDKLATLAADAIVCLRDISVKEKSYLIDESIFKIAPLESRERYGKYSQTDDKWFDYFYKAFKNVLSTKDVHLGEDKVYVDVNHALKVDNVLRSLLSRKQLNQLIDFYKKEKEGTSDYHYVCINTFPKRSEALANYFKAIGLDTFVVDEFGEFFTKEFIQKQDDEWILKMFKFLNTEEARRLIEEYVLNLSNVTTKAHLLRKPFIKTTKGDFVCPIIDNEPNVFINDGSQKLNLNYVDITLASNPFVQKVLAKIGIATPNKKVLIENTIFPKYNEGCRETKSSYILDFIAVYDAYLSCDSYDAKQFIEKIRNNFCFLATDGKLHKHKEGIYLPNTDFIKVFTQLSNVYILDINYYRSQVTKSQLQDFEKFLNEIGFPKYLKIQTIVDAKLSENYKQRINIEQIEGCTFQSVFDGNGKYHTIKTLTDEKITDYDLELIKNFGQDESVNMEFSMLIWKTLQNTPQLSNYWNAKCSYQPYADYRYRRKSLTFLSSLALSLQNTAWLLSVKDEKWHKPSDIYVEDLSKMYGEDETLYSLLGIEHSPQTQDMEFIMENCSKTTQEDVAMGQLMRKYGLKDTEDIVEFAEFKKEKERREYEAQQEEERKQKRAEEKAKIEELRNVQQGEESYTHKQKRHDAQETFNAPAQNTPSSKLSSRNNKALTDEQVEEMRRQEETRNQLRSIANDLNKKYTYEWVKALLELEFEASGEATSSKKGIEIVFAKVEKDPYSEKGIMLKNPSRNIPLILEEMNNLAVTFRLPNDVHPTIIFEVASVQDYVLRLKCKNGDINEVDKLLSVADKVYRAELKTGTPIQLIAELQKSYEMLELEDTYSLRDNIDETIKFIFGPPGTGKTTHLVTKWISKVASCPKAKMLILCPTNKAADVIAKRALEKIDSRSNPQDWLFRFVTTADDELTNQICSRDRAVYEQDKCCIISTIARFAYDGFTYVKLKDIDWDYIVIDEASMIPLAQILYPIYKCPASQFVIAGDPFQIEPIVHEELWKDENIYKMIQLDNFKEPHTIPCQFEITNLPIQYRAIPAIGNLYSEYAYDGEVLANRTQNSQHTLVIRGYDIKSINFVMFPVQNWQSIYGPQNIVGSNIHIYSAIFTYEFTKYLAQNIETLNDDKAWRIGIISPYKAQAEIINKLWEQRDTLYKNVDVAIGTVHGFQGDECDIIIAVYNPPCSGMKRFADQTFVNKKNILNVAISRAQDYLFILMPDEEYENFNKLETKTIGYIANKNPQEMTKFNSQDIEKIIFGDAHFIEKNTFVTTHQLANVYSAPSSLYEVRFDEKSIDIQIK